MSQVPQHATHDVHAKHAVHLLNVLIDNGVDMHAAVLPLSPLSCFDVSGCMHHSF